MWYPIDTIPKDGKEYVVGKFYKGPSPEYDEVDKITSVFFVNDRDARDMEPYWAGGDSLDEDEIYIRYTHWTYTPKD